MSGVIGPKIQVNPSPESHRIDRDDENVEGEPLEPRVGVMGDHVVDVVDTKLLSQGLSQTNRNSEINALNQGLSQRVELQEMASDPRMSLNELEKAYKGKFSEPERFVLSRELLQYEPLVYEQNMMVPTQATKALAREMVATAMFISRNELAAISEFQNHDGQATPRFEETARFNIPDENPSVSQGYTQHQQKVLKDAIKVIFDRPGIPQGYEGAQKPDINHLEGLSEARLDALRQGGLVVNSGGQEVRKSKQDLFNQFVEFANQTSLSEANWLALLKAPPEIASDRYSISYERFTR
jgi:hypothetical protein